MTERKHGVKCGSPDEPCSCSCETKSEKIVEYEHHGENVKVREDLKGRHRDHCLCFRCNAFKPTAHNKELMAEFQDIIRDTINFAEAKLEEGCARSAVLFALCCELGMTTPVWECPDCEENE